MSHAPAGMAQAVAEHAGLAGPALGRLLLRSPRLTQYSGGVVARGAALLRDRLGVSTAQLAAMAAKHPLVLAASPARLDALLGFLTAELGARCRLLRTRARDWACSPGSPARLDALLGFLAAELGARCRLLPFKGQACFPRLARAPGRAARHPHGRAGCALPFAAPQLLQGWRGWYQSLAALAAPGNPRPARRGIIEREP